MKNSENAECETVPTEWLARILSERTHTGSISVILRDALEWANFRCRGQFTLDQIQGPSRKVDVVAVRHWMSWRLRIVARWSHPKIAMQLGGRDHATIMHGIGKINASLGLPRNWPDDIRSKEKRAHFITSIPLIADQLRAGESIVNLAVDYGVGVLDIKAQFVLQGFDYEEIKREAARLRTERNYGNVFYPQRPVLTDA